MLVSCLENASLSTMLSDHDVDYSCVHESLCRCVRELLAKYEQKQECSVRQVVKSLALKTLLSALDDAPANSRTTISSALKCHAVMLKGYEHLLSARGNTCELMKQTQGLREAHNNACASLLRYHDLKNRLLGPDTPLSAEQGKVLSALAEKKSLALKTLEIVEAYPGTTAKELMKLNEIILGTPELCAGAFNNKDSIRLARIFIRLHEAGMRKPDLCAIIAKCEADEIDGVGIPYDEAVIALERLGKACLFRPYLCAGVIKHEIPCLVVDALVELKRNKLDTPGNCSAVLKHKEPLQASLVINHLRSCNFISDENQGLVLKHERPFSAFKALEYLDKEGQLNPNFSDLALEHPSPFSTALALVSLQQYKLDAANNCSEVIKKKYPGFVCRVIIDLHICDLLTDKNLEKILRHEHFNFIAGIFIMLRKTLRTRGNLYAVINHPDIDKLYLEIRSEFKFSSIGTMDQGKFEACLARSSFVAGRICTNINWMQQITALRYLRRNIPNLLLWLLLICIYAIC